ncbi:hypothetical protein GQR58_029729 [Nymphon striatum]|nr:hypothetical protein GQR58_029729 [Nymphon striatum]
MSRRRPRQLRRRCRPGGGYWSAARSAPTTTRSVTNKSPFSGVTYQAAVLVAQADLDVDDALWSRRPRAPRTERPEHGDRDYCEKQAFATFHESSVRSTPCTGEGEKGVRKPVRDRKSTSALNLRNQPQGRNQTLVVIDEALFVVTSDDPEPISDAEPAVEVIERNIDFDAKRSSTAAGS